MNILLAEKIIQKAVQQGVSEFCVCAGARNSPLVFLLDKCTGIQVHNFFEERSAAFFALGRIQKTERPVAVVTTSGTAAAELLPAVIEANYTAKPLLLITADRPRRYRGTGAPQAIEQVGIFSHYAQTTIDVASSDLSSLDYISDHFNQWTFELPLHINVCFEEPLIDGEIHPIHFPKIKYEMPSYQKLQTTQQKTLDQPLVIVGQLPNHQIEIVTKFLEDLGAPIYAESLSGLRGQKSIESLLLKGGEKSVQKCFDEGWAKSVLRIGGVPTLRFWRDLEEKFHNIPVISISETDYPGLARGVQHLVGYQALSLLTAGDKMNAAKKLLFEFDLELSKKLQALLDRYPMSESALINKLSQRIHAESTTASIYLGNSLPIREWDLVTNMEFKFKRIFGNRGANGIDGQLSTFLGWASSESMNWALVGDLTAMYDLAALWISPKLKGVSLRIVVINNKGGQIFKNIFKNEVFLNRHNIQFQKWAEMWNWGYQKWTDVPTDRADLSEKVVIELLPNEEQSDLFWQEYQSL